MARLSAAEGQGTLILFALEDSGDVFHCEWVWYSFERFDYWYVFS